MTPSSATSQPTQASSSVTTIIPYTNPSALIGYYLGVFSCFPLLGLPLAIGELILGFMGLQKALRQPESKGKVHAIVALATGSIGLSINLLVCTGMLFA